MLNDFLSELDETGVPRRRSLQRAVILKTQKRIIRHRSRKEKRAHDRTIRRQNSENRRSIEIRIALDSSVERPGTSFM
jgi:hypothetical protein